MAGETNTSTENPKPILPISRRSRYCAAAAGVGQRPDRTGLGRSGRVPRQHPGRRQGRDQRQPRLQGSARGTRARHLWLAALWEGYTHLEMEVVRRLRQGDHFTLDAGRYDFANAIRLLAAHRDTASQAMAQQRNVSAAEVRASIDRKVEEIRLRLKHERARADGAR